MRCRLAVEDIEPRHWVAWVLDHPGCHSAAATEQAAVAGAPARIRAWADWLRAGGQAVARLDELVEVEVVEVFCSFISEGDYRVNAFFEDDARPLTRGDIDAGLALLALTRRDLLTVLDPLASPQLARPAAGGRGSSVAEILDDIVWAEWWYLTRLDLAFGRDEMPEDPLARLEKVREHTRAQLPQLEGDPRVTELVGERWSARKVLRRTLWHERDHTLQIEQLPRASRD
jgi:hypothetical protein